MALDKLFCPVGAGSTPASGFQFFIEKLFISREWTMMKLTMQILSSHLVIHHIMFGNILLLQTTLMPWRKAKKGGAKDAICVFCDKSLWMQHV